ncbi:MAG: hypothetical protein K8J31_28440 [Anaerolineae bacterium]|nr:hypothetical protein [Anaerolineae bacterium]
MVSFDASNSHFQYLDVVRHWSPISQKYAGGDAVITLFSEGWRLKESVFYEEFWLSGSRLVVVYHLEMARDEDTLNVPVLSNPYVDRMMTSLPLQVRPIRERAIQRQPR